jgi:cell wall-associated NlpC family hydrolase
LAATKKHAAAHKKTNHTVAAVTHTRITKKQKTLVRTTKSPKIKNHRLAHQKRHHQSQEQKNLASIISISYEGATLIANENRETPIKTAVVNRKALDELTTPKRRESRETRHEEATRFHTELARAEEQPAQEETSFLQSIANSINLSPGKLATPDEKSEIQAQTISVPALRSIPKPAYLRKAALPVPAEAVAPIEAEAPPAPAPVVTRTSFAASVERHLVNFVHKTVATLRYSDYKLGGRKFDTSRGVYVVDCSSFVDHILQRVSPRAYLSLVSASGADTPATQHYYEFFTELTNGPDNFWNKVEAVDQLRPGDILVFRYKNSRGSETGGHVMVVMDKPIRDSDVFFVRVADSAPSRHSQDTRQWNEAGIGIGTLVLKINPRTGRPAAYAWGLGGLWNKNVNFAMARPLDTSEFG